MAARTLEQYRQQQLALAEQERAEKAAGPAYELPPDVPTLEEIDAQHARAIAARERLEPLLVNVDEDPESTAAAIKANAAEWNALFKLELTRARAMVAVELPELTTDAEEIERYTDPIAEALAAETTRAADLTPGAVSMRYLQFVRGNYSKVTAELQRMAAAGELTPPPGTTQDAYIKGLEAIALSGSGALEQWADDEAIRYTREALQQYQEGKKDAPKAPPAVWIAGRGADNVSIPTDKLYRHLWAGGVLKPGSGSVDVTSTEKARGHKIREKVSVKYSVSFKEIQKDPNVTISAPEVLTERHNSIYTAIDAVMQKHGDTFPLTQIAYTMGIEAPHREDIDNIEAAILPMMHAPLFIDNAAEHAAYPNYPHYRYSSVLLPAEIVSVEVNGKTATCIHVFRELPLFAYARSKNQITTVSRDVWALPLNNTAAADSIRNYLIGRIAPMKTHKTYSRVIDYEEMCKATGNTKSRTQKARAKEKALVILEHFKKTGYISGYAEDAGRKTVTLKVKTSPQK